MAISPLSIATSGYLTNSISSISTDGYIATVVISIPRGGGYIVNYPKDINKDINENKDNLEEILKDDEEMLDIILVMIKGDIL